MKRNNVSATAMPLTGSKMRDFANIWIIKNGGNIMNAIQIRNMMLNIKADFVGMGRPWHLNDNSVMELLMQVYYQTEIIDWEEVKWLFITYLEKGILDFPTAKKMAIKRISA